MSSKLLDKVKARMKAEQRQSQEEDSEEEYDEENSDYQSGSDDEEQERRNKVVAQREAFNHAKKLKFRDKKLQKVAESMSKPLNLKKFNLNWLPQGIVMLLIGNRGLGKTSFMREFCIKNRKKFGAVVVVSGTETYNNAFDEVCDNMFKHDALTDLLLAKIMKRQELVLDTLPPGLKNPNLLFIIDDMAYDKKPFKTQLAIWFCYNCRHIKVTVMISAQRPNAIPCEWRTQCSFCASFLEKDEGELEILFKEIFSCIGEKQTFFMTHRRVTTQPYTMLVYFRNPRALGIIERQVFWYKCDEFPENMPLNQTRIGWDGFLNFAAIFGKPPKPKGKFNWEQDFSFVDQMKEQNVEMDKDADAQQDEDEEQGGKRRSKKKGNVANSISEKSLIESLITLED